VPRDERRPAKRETSYGCCRRCSSYWSSSSS